MRDKADDAIVLVIKNDVNYMLKKSNKEKLFEELVNLDWDKKAFIKILYLLYFNFFFK